MAVLLVTYDLNKETTRPPLLKDLKETYPTWARLSESSYAIETSSTPSQVYNRLKRHIDDNDNIIVVHLRRPHDGWASKKVHDWLSQKLPY